MLWEVMESPGPLLGTGLERELAEVFAHKEDLALIGEWALGGPKLLGSCQELGDGRGSQEPEPLGCEGQRHREAEESYCWTLQPM